MVVDRFVKVMASSRALVLREDFVRIRMVHVVDVSSSYSAALSTLLALSMNKVVPEKYNWR